MDAVAYAMEFSGAVIYLFREKYDQLRRKLIKELKERVPQISKNNPHGLYKFNETELTASFTNGSMICFRYVKNLKDAEQYDGIEMDYVGVDELTKHTKKVIEQLRSCLRSPKGFPPRFKGTCNPGGEPFTNVA